MAAETEAVCSVLFSLHSLPLLLLGIVAQSAVSRSPTLPPLCLARGLSTHVCYVFSCLILIIIPGIIIIVAVSVVVPHRFLSAI